MLQRSAVSRFTATLVSSSVVKHVPRDWRRPLKIESFPESGKRTLAGGCE